MRILVLSRNAFALPPNSGGLANACKREIAALVAAGHQVSVVTTRDGKGKQGNYISEYEGCKVFWIDSPPKYTPQFRKGVRQIFVRDKTKFDFALSMSQAGHSILDIGNRPPIIFRAHGLAVSMPQNSINLFFRTRNKAFLERAKRSLHRIYTHSYNKLSRYDGLACLSANERHDLSVRFFIDMEKVIVLNSCLKAKQVKAKKQYDFLLCALTLHLPIKGVNEVLIELKRRKIEACVIGGGCQFLRSKFPLMTFLGKLSHEKLLAAFASGKVLIDGSIHYSGTNITTIEAASQGTPAVAFRTGGNEDLINHGKSGLLVPGLSAKLLIDAAIKVRRDWLKYSKGAKAHYSNRFTPGRYASRLVSFAAKIIGKK